MKKELIDALIKKYKVQTVGNGYADCIVAPNDVRSFILDLDKIGVTVAYVDWWCHCTPDNIKKHGCPHGLGGPKSVYYGDWFSELTHFGSDKLSSNNEALDYIFNIAPNEKYYSPCLFPSLLLDVELQEENTKKFVNLFPNGHTRK